MAEGDPESKLESITQTAYLAYCLEAMGKDHGPLVVLGHTLSPADAHIADAIAKRPSFKRRIILVGIYPPASPVEQQVQHFRDVLGWSNIELHLFDSREHLLGDPRLLLSE